MSKHETPMIQWFWDREGGTLIEEYEICKKEFTYARRLIDAIILPTGQRVRLEGKGRNEINLEQQDVVVVQAKAYRLGMYLMGQALFSAELVKALKPRSIRTVALCKYDDSMLRPLAEKYGIEVVITPNPLPKHLHQ